MTSDDHSVYIGGNVSGSQVASGQNVTQNQQIAPADRQLTAAFDRVEALLDKHAADLAEPDKARRDLADARAEAGEPEPDRDRIHDSLKRLARRVAAVGVLTEAVQLLMDGLLG